MEETYTIPGFFVTQPIGDFFVGKIPADILRKIAYADIRRLEDRKIETYTGIQRPLSADRVKEITQYIRTVDATFPNTIIVSIESRNIVDSNENSLIIKLTEESVKIIDGQHRLAGFNETNSIGFELVISVFVDAVLEDQALIFSIINLKQTKVNKSLVYDLFELSSIKGPQKICHEIAKSLNSDPAAPFYRRIKLLGRKIELYEGILTQGTFVKYLLPMISDNPDKDVDLLKRNEPLPFEESDIKRGKIFRKFFIQKEEWAILKILINYFNAVKKSFPNEWSNVSNVLGRSIGYGALMKLLQKHLFLIGVEQNQLDEGFFLKYFSLAAGKLELNFENYPANAGGENKLYSDFVKQMGLS